MTNDSIPEVDDTTCPRCGLSYDGDGAPCSHCGYPASHKNALGATARDARHTFSGLEIIRCALLAGAIIGALSVGGVYFAAADSFPFLKGIVESTVVSTISGVVAAVVAMGLFFAFLDDAGCLVGAVLIFTAGGTLFFCFGGIGMLVFYVLRPLLVGAVSGAVLFGVPTAIGVFGFHVAHA